MSPLPNSLTTSATGRTYGGLNAQTRNTIRHEQFLAAGLEVFGTTGFRAATVRSICKQAKLTDRYFYQSFGSLENLLMATYESCMVKLRADVLKSIQSEYNVNGTYSAISAGLNSYFKHLEDPKIAQICMIELEGISLEVNSLYYGYIDDFAEMLISLTRYPFPDWSLAAEQKKTLSISLVGAMRQAATNWLIGGYKTDRKMLVEATSLLFLGIIQIIEKQSESCS